LEQLKTNLPGGSLWLNRRFNFLICSQIVSNLGDWMYILALIILIGVRWHSSPITISMMMLCITTPVLLLGPLAGVLADHFNRTVLMIISNLAMAGCIFAIPLVPAKWMVFCLLICIGAFESLFSPSEQAKLKEIVLPEQLDSAIPLTSTIAQLTKVIGPGLSGILVGIFGANIGFYLDSISFVISTIFLLFTGFKGTNITSTESEASSSGSIFEQFLDGWSYLRKQRSLLIGAILVALIILVLQLSDSQFITILRLLPHLSANFFGYAIATSGLGAVLSAILIGKYPKPSSIFFISSGSIIVGLGFGGIAMAIDLHVDKWVILGLSFFTGFGAGLVFTPFQLMVQKMTAEEFTGRVFGFVGSLTTAAALMGPLAGGLLITVTGAIDGFLITGIGLATIGAISIAFKNWIEPRTSHAKSNECIQGTTST